MIVITCHIVRGKGHALGFRAGCLYLFPCKRDASLWSPSAGQVVFRILGVPRVGPYLWNHKLKALPHPPVKRNDATRQSDDPRLSSPRPGFPFQKLNKRPVSGRLVFATAPGLLAQGCNLAALAVRGLVRTRTTSWSAAGMQCCIQSDLVNQVLIELHALTPVTHRSANLRQPFLLHAPKDP